MKSIFKSVKGVRNRKNTFNLDHRFRVTASIGQIFPCFIRDCVPNSDFKVSAHNMTRMLAMLAPIMDDVELYVHFWKIPYRLLDEDFQKWIGGEIADEDYNPPYFSRKGIEDYITYLEASATITADNLFKAGSLFDLCGIPVLSSGNTWKISARYIQWYALLLKYRYLNENIGIEDESGSLRTLWLAIEDLTDKTLQGDVSIKIYDFMSALYMVTGSTFMNHAWTKDYFTSALPYIQRGEPVSIPLSGSAPVSIPPQQVSLYPIAPNNYIGIRGGNGSIIEDKGQLETRVPIDGESTSLGGLMYNIPDSSETGKVTSIIGKLSGRVGMADSVTDLSGTANLSESSAVSINELRILNALQVYKERVMRFGHRYYEYLQGFFGQKSSDARLQLPEWIGGGKVPIMVSEVEQNSATGSTGTPQGNLSGIGKGFATGFAGFKHTHIEEESLIVGVAFLLPKSAYCQGLSRFHTKLNDRYDFYNPSFDHLGEQAIVTRELYAEGAWATKKTAMEAILGYTPRFAEYRVWPDETHGDFKGSLAYWTLTRIFSDVPKLNKDLIYVDNSTVNRIFAIQDGTPNVLIDMYFQVAARQPMSKYGTPMLLA